MARYTATQGITGSYDINEIDADGIGIRRLYVGYDRSVPYHLGEKAARLLILAMSLPGGIEEATTLIRAQIVRES
ncbi:MAG: hypothetical protein ACRYG8_53670 [Janthinobacterium lividum]